MTIRSRENIISAAIALGCVAFLIWVIPAYTPPYPGYGVSAALLPNVTVGLMLALSLLSLAKNLWSQRGAPAKDGDTGKREEIGIEDRVHFRHVLRFMVPSALLMPAMKLAGFIPAGIAFMLLTQYLCGQRKPLPAVLTAAGTVLALYAVMRFGLGVPMP